MHDKETSNADRTDKHASVPAIETLEVHIIGGAIIPLWQRFKTHEEARLRVVRVTTDDGQRIVGIRIPRELVGAIVRSLGAIRDLYEPREVFVEILDEGEEVELISGLKLCRRFLDREPVIELCGADPYLFAELRTLGLINEQIDWKQRFFIPTDEERGMAVLDSLLGRYPIVPSTASDEWAIANIVPQESSRPQMVNLDEWFVPVAETALALSLVQDESENSEAASSLSTLCLAQANAPTEGIRQLALDFG